ncbi:hypothetical protein [Variovorax sp. AFSI2.2]|uniref:hypothetical protein n=1 Tax=Variovorax sp. AFSI2.2 TaxID=3384160 RepID=UPI003EBE438F
MMTEQALPTPAEAAPVTHCALCLKRRVLVVSHIIPNAYFRAMKRPSNGKLVAMDTDPNTRATYSQDSLSEPLLCSDCEGHFGKWETSWIRKLRLTAKLFTDGVESVAVPSFEYESFRCFLISIVWRAAVCSRQEFSLVKFPEDGLEKIRVDLCAGKAPTETVIGNRVRKLVDPSGQLKLTDLENFMFTPMPLSEGGLQGYRLFFAGYVVDFITSKVTRRVSNVPGFVRDTLALKIPAVSVFQVRDFMRMGMYMVEKHVRGQTAFGSGA